MGKKVSQASLKISKNEKQQFNSLIKVLRPKVYITDSSNFKKLVQELTGNGSSTTSPESSPLPLQPKVAENCPLRGDEVQRDLETSYEVSVSTEATNSSSDLWYAALMNEDSDQQAENCPLMGAEVQRDLETSFEASVSTEATNSSSDLWYAALMNEEYQQACNQICLDDRVLEESLANQSLDHLMAYQNLEPLLLDAELNPFYNCYAQIEQEVSIYDYELSGLI